MKSDTDFAVLYTRQPVLSPALSILRGTYKKEYSIIILNLLLKEITLHLRLSIQPVSLGRP
jgi:hypothetical protein